ncbi:enkurin-like [Corticium candelabrum]|uniref:enkurin-like n=1 Tax=Corticium candelabrum TaxID=121492 RepID=UPI002E266676|nr:enkurin-like [Corticium candelabrum]
MEQSEESIYNLVAQERMVAKKPARYQSKFRSMTQSEYKARKQGANTMGPAKVPLNSTQDFLKKRSGEPKLPEPSPFKYPDKEKRPTVPTRKDQPMMGVKCNKDFIKTNAVETINSVAKKPSERYADTVKGATHALTPSGLVPKYLQKKDYGKTPGYLTKRREEMEQAQREYEEYVEESRRQGALKQIQDDERDVILAGLKKNWEEVHHQYQGLSVVADTAPKKARKERMEAEMKQLEKDIEMIEKHKVIYIAHDQPKFWY